MWVGGHGMECVRQLILSGKKLEISTIGAGDAV